MLPITGYADRWSVRPGETIQFMVSVAGGESYTARVARMQCGDPNPAGPGYRETPAPSPVDGTHAGLDQPIAIGSWADIPQLDLGAPGQGIALVATIWPSLVAKPDQAVLEWSGADASLTLGIGPDGAWCRLVTPSGTRMLQTHVPLTERAWHDIACFADPVRGTLSLGQSPRRTRLDRVEAAQAVCPVCAAGLGGMGVAAIAATRRDGPVGSHYNGKIERPCVLAAPADLGGLLQRQAAGAPHDAVIAAWDFSRDIRTDAIIDTGPGGWHGRCLNLPNRAMTGSNWTGEEQRWTAAPAQYGAIHFHDDDVGDAAWQPSLNLTVPADWPSGVYALHLQSGAARDNIVFYVRAAQPGVAARVAFLAPTMTYTIYGQYQKAGKQAANAARADAWGSLPHAPDGHPEYGVSPYNYHSDGSGVGFASMRRPMIDKRMNQFHLMDPDPGGSGLYWMAADTYIIDLLTRRGIAYEVITDHDVHAEGAALLSRYQVVLTGQHPEYHTTQTLDAIAAYTNTGGRFMYLGGNGFYWKIVPHGDGPWALEIRRAEGGIRLWETLPGESYHAFDGSYGGLWRRLGRPPQALVGVGFSCQGEYNSYPYTFTDAIMNPRVAFMREGLEGVAAPGIVFGEHGLMGGGAAGHELDRADTKLGTPPHAIVIAGAVVTDPTFQPVNEERRDHTWPGKREEIIRSDLTFFETAQGGAVFSVGSMCFIGALPVNGYDNAAAALIENIVRRFADPAPFAPPQAGMSIA
jgi:N,N-dimethylformamidase